MTKEDTSVSFDEKQKQSEQIEQKDTDMYNQAITEQDKDVCLAIQDPDQKSECTDMVSAGLAQKADNPELCKTLTSTGIRERCSDNINFSHAETRKDKNICATISDQNLQNSCKQGIDNSILQDAIKNQTVTSDLCDQIDPSLQGTCRWNLQVHQDSQTFASATKSRTLESCAGIADLDLKNTCRDIVFLDQAVKQNDPNICKSILDTEKQALCTAQIGRKSDVKKFPTIVASLDIESCKMLNDQNLQNQCHDQIIIMMVRNNKDPDLCESLIDEKLKTSCKKIPGE